MDNKYFWKTTADKAEFSKLTTTEEADVAIVGAGITGLTAAMRLVDSGKKVIILEAKTVADSATSNSSAHLTTSSDYYYSKIISKYGKTVAKEVAASRKTAIDFISVMSERFPCDFFRVPGYLYAEQKDDSLKNEFAAASDAGLQVAMEQKVPLPFLVQHAVKFDDQAIFNPYRYMLQIARYLQDSSLCTIHESSRVIERDGAILKTGEGSVKAKEIVYATHYPLFIDMHQTLVYPYRSYMLAASVKEDIGDELFWDTAEPYHYTRSYNYGDTKWLLVGGADHKTGETNKEAFANLEEYLHERYSVNHIDFRWSSQYYEPADGLPFIGKSYSGNEYIGTGYSGDGLVFGTLAGMLIADSIAQTNLYKNWHNIFDARRVNIKESAGKFGKENLSVASHMIKDRIKARNMNEIPEVNPGDGLVVNVAGKNMAVSKSHTGELNVVSAVCPHLKCVVTWNTLDKTWDCPCHGSRFTQTGEVIAGPAVQKLETLHVAENVKK